MHALTTHHPFSSYSFNNSLVPVPSPFPNPSTPTTTTHDRTLPRRSPSPNPGIPWNHLFATSLFPTNPPQTTSACPAAAMANPQQSTIPLNEAGVLMRSEIGPHPSRDYFNCNRRSNSRSSTNQIDSNN
ncbi:hypothetical protein BCR33DRAFT_728937 [Rhizoclosmatium globosum]|uniref:Uncharacterized protein n=1 Tax=Rhizoclosmatium globosum TaxID=329046 RepID=A0A1Y2AHH0_9FUNG|nr:hypothetical protein BCR33DRAFT_728937 [Rhizoclosmatium globosum]|eukprot:ORY22048.1 hypothetical protein BCR33DRAFT_728937 [Rhizoclosmatium globosum]